MKVLWFAVTPSLYAANNTEHNGGGWISSLEKQLREDKSIELGVAFEFNDTEFSVVKDSVTYFPIDGMYKRWNRMKSRFLFNTEENVIIPQCIKIIENFKPDVIHIFGSEWCFGLLTEYINIPIVIHLQGSIPPYYNARFPPGYNIYNYLIYNKFNFKKSIGRILGDISFKKRVKREERILRNCKNFMGRTHWDRLLTNLYHPHSNYYHCNEVLRPEITGCLLEWRSQEREKLILVSTISNNLLKGLDVIFKTAKLLKENTDICFEWHLLGPKDLLFIEWKEKVKAADINIYPKGVVSASIITEELLNCDAYIHPSYIDNSPNAVCEAQYLGVPVIATNVGGISTLVDHNINGLLFPANDPYTLAHIISSIKLDPLTWNSLGSNAAFMAKERHDPEKIVNDLKMIYKSIMRF